MIRVVHPGSGSRILTFYPSRTQGSRLKKAPDPGSASLPLPEIKVAVPSISAQKGQHKAFFCPIVEKEKPNDQQQWWPHRLSQEDTLLKVTDV
jgi:hypothetical protein